MHVSYMHFTDRKQEDLKKTIETAMELAFLLLFFFIPLKIITFDHLMRINSVDFDFTFHAQMN